MTNDIEPGTSWDTDVDLTHESAGFHGAVAQLYRGEMQRVTVWRQRLDVTSNWAILLIVALITFALGSPEVPHFTLLLGLALIAISVLIEGRRYCHLHHSGWRLYLIERGYFAQLLQPADPSLLDWRRLLAEDLRRPKLRLSWFAGTRIRLRRNYLMILYFVTVAWITKLFIHPQRPSTLQEFHDRLAVGELLPPWFVALSALVFVAGATLLVVTCPPAEKFEKWDGTFLNDPEINERTAPPPRPT